MLASPSRFGAASAPVLVLILLAAAIVVGYAWYRGHMADDLRSGIGERTAPGEQAIRAPQRDWAYGPVHHQGGAAQP